MQFIDENTVKLHSKSTGKDYTVPYSQLTSLGFSQQTAEAAKNMYQFGGKPTLLQTAVEMMPNVFGAIGGLAGGIAIPIPGVGGALGVLGGEGGGYAARDLLRPLVGTKIPSVAQRSLEQAGGQPGAAAALNFAKSPEVAGTIGKAAVAGAVDLAFNSLFTRKNADFVANKVTNIAKDNPDVGVSIPDFANEFRTAEAAKHGTRGAEQINKALDNFIRNKGTYNPQDITEKILNPADLLQARRQIYSFGYSANADGMQKIIDQDLALFTSSKLHQLVPDTRLLDQTYHLLAGAKDAEKLYGGYATRASIRYWFLYPFLKGMVR